MKATNLSLTLHEIRLFPIFAQELSLCQLLLDQTKVNPSSPQEMREIETMI